MIFKLSLKNIKKSIRDYSIYFITLTVAVALSYIFNLLPYQPFMSAFTKEASQDLGYLLSKMSVPITVIVAGLALYSNNFLLKRRSREIGIYLILGTKYIHIHLMMLFETLFISIGSFIAGLGLGMGLARVFDLLIVNLLGLQIKESSVLFAMPALFETIKCFALIFVMIAIFNYFVISKAKLIDIVRSNGEALRTNRFKNNLMVQSTLFVLSICAIVYFYMTLSQANVNFSDIKTTIALIAGFIGHIMMFLSGAGVLAYFTDKNKKKLYKGTNLFTLKQITNKISKNGVMLGIISFIMTITMIMLNIGVSSHLWIDENLKYTAPYSISASGIQPNVPANKVVEYIQSKGYTIKDMANYKMYDSKSILGDFLNKSKLNKISEDYSNSANSNVKVMKLSDYNKCRKILGFKEITIPQDSVALSVDKNILPAFSPKDRITLYGKSLAVKSSSVYTEPISDTRGVAGFGVTIVVNDSVVENTKEELFYTVSLAVNTKADGKGAILTNKDLYDFIASYNGGHGVIIQSEMRDYNLKQASVIIFTGLFIGLILLIVGASILSLQQMTEITENKHGYEIIKKLGVTDSNINQSIFKQIITYFMIPLAISSIHSVFGTMAYSTYTHLTVNSNTFLFSILVSLGIIFAIYSSYILFTYSRCKKYIY